VPLVLLAILIHFAILSGNQNKFLKMREIVPLSEKSKKPSQKVENSEESANPNSISSFTVSVTEPIVSPSGHKTRRGSVMQGISVVEELRHNRIHDARNNSSLDKPEYNVTRRTNILNEEKYDDEEFDQVVQRFQRMNDYHDTSESESDDYDSSALSSSIDNIHHFHSSSNSYREK
jgi:hypothetical protein